MKKLINIFTTVAFLSQFANAQLEYSQNNIPFRDLPREHDRALTVLDSAALDSFIIATMDQYHIPGVSACIIREGDIYWSGVYGYSNIEQNQPVTDTTTFIIASLSKPFTATALMQLWEEGLFGLDDNINNYLPPELQIINPSFPNDSITFRQLLTHTSSIDNDWDLIVSLYSWGSDSPIPLDSLLVNYFMPGGNYYSWGPFNNWAPGAQWEYSNYALALVGYLVEAIADTPFADYCQENIFTPLGMNETSWFLDGLDTSNIAIPYSYTNNNYIPYQHYGYPDYPDGQLRTSATQLARFLTTYMQMGEIDGIRILDSATVDLMTTVQYPALSSTRGLVWFVFDHNLPFLGTRTYIGHAGSDYGCRTEMFYLLDSENQFGITLLTNGESEGGKRAIGDQLAIFGFLSQRIYAQNIELSSHFMQPDIDTLIITTQFNNPDNHSFSANALITSIDSTIVDSISLFDDGNHGDGQADDDLWGCFIPPVSSETEFIVGVSTVDLDSGVYFSLNDLARFTTIGPVVYEDLDFIGSDTIPNPGEQLIFRPVLKNDGSMATATDVTAELSSNDTSVFNLVAMGPSWGDIVAGETAHMTSGFYMLQILDTCPPDHDIPIQMSIASEGYFFWCDSFTIHVFEPVGIADEGRILPNVYVLDQNYPNPFNPITTIKYGLPEGSKVTLKIYDILGREVSTLANEHQEAGYHQISWNATDHSSGIYFYQIQAGEFQKASKMVLVK